MIIENRSGEYDSTVFAECHLVALALLEVEGIHVEGDFGSALEAGDHFLDGIGDFLFGGRVS